MRKEGAEIEPPSSAEWSIRGHGGVAQELGRVPVSLRQQEGATVAWAEGQPSELQSLVSFARERGLQVNLIACEVALCMSVCVGG